MLATTSRPFNACSFNRSMTFSESWDESPEVGSSTKSTPGSLISSRAMLSLLRWPPLINFFRGFPTFKCLVSSSSRSIRIWFTRLNISCSEKWSKQSFALKYRFSNTLSSSRSKSSCGTNPIRPWILSGSLWISMPLIVILPSCGLILPLNRLIRVDFPTPLPPIMPISCPESSSKLNFLMPLELFLNWNSISSATKCTLDVTSEWWNRFATSL